MVIVTIEVVGCGHHHGHAVVEIGPGVTTSVRVTLPRDCLLAIDASASRPYMVIVRGGSSPIAGTVTINSGPEAPVGAAPPRLRLVNS